MDSGAPLSRYEMHVIRYLDLSAAELPMHATCFRPHNLAEPQMERWVAMPGFTSALRYGYL